MKQSSDVGLVDNFDSYGRMELPEVLGIVYFIHVDQANIGPILHSLVFLHSFLNISLDKEFLIDGFH